MGSPQNQPTGPLLLPASPLLARRTELSPEGVGLLLVLYGADPEGLRGPDPGFDPGQKARRDGEELHPIC